MKRFDQCGNALECAITEINEDIILEDIDDLAPSSRQAEEANIEMCDAMDHYIMHPATHQHTRYDIRADIDCGSNLYEEVVINNRLSDEEYKNSSKSEQ